MNKHFVLIVSGGRTATNFLGNFLSEIIEGAYSVHEPDTSGGFDRKTWEGIKTFGVYQMVLGRILGLTGLRNLNENFLASNISFDNLIKSLKKYRKQYYSSLNTNMIIESNKNWSGILPAVPKLFQHYKVLGIIRDPRSWVVSVQNKRRLLREQNLIYKLRFKKNQINEKILKKQHKLHKLADFEGICWNWVKIYENINSFIENNPNTLLVRYEDLFQSNERNKHFQNMLEFITNFEEKSFNYKFYPEILDKKTNISEKTYLSDWKAWKSEDAKQLNEICGSLMKKFGYGNEYEWIDKINANDR